VTGRWANAWRHRHLLAETAVALLGANLRVRTRRGADLVAALGDTAQETTQPPSPAELPSSTPPLSVPQMTAARDIGWAVELLAVRGPLRTACLGQALAAQALLRRRQIPSVLTVGLGRGSDGKLRAHAWLRAGDRTVVGGRGREDFAPLAEFR